MGEESGMTFDYSMTLLRTAPFNFVSADVIIGAVDNMRIVIVNQVPYCNGVRQTETAC
jgi:hypothetical protein